MSRAARHESRRMRTIDRKIAWVDRIKAILGDGTGKKWREVCEVLAAEVEQEIEQNPQQKAEIIEDWAELFQNLDATARKMAAEDASPQGDPCKSSEQRPGPSA